MSRRDDLLRSPLFRNLPEDAIHMVENALTERNFAAGEILLSQEAPGESLLIVTSGSLKISRGSLGGRERILGYAYAPTLIGEIAVLITNERVATVTALEPVRALMLYRDYFLQLMHRYPEVLWNLARMLADRVTDLNDELIALGVNTEAALSHALLTLYHQRKAASLPRAELLPLTQRDLMSRLSSSRETISRVLKRLEDDRLLRVVTASSRARSSDSGPDSSDPEKSSYIELLDIEALEALVYGIDRTQ